MHSRLGSYVGIDGVIYGMESCESGDDLSRGKADGFVDSGCTGFKALLRPDAVRSRRLESSTW